MNFRVHNDDSLVEALSFSSLIGIIDVVVESALNGLDGDGGDDTAIPAPIDEGDRFKLDGRDAENDIAESGVVVGAADSAREDGKDGGGGKLKWDTFAG